MGTALALSFLAIIEGYGMAGKRAVVAAFLLLVSACGGGGGGTGGGGTATLGSGKLVFVSDRTGNPEVYVADSSGQQNVTNDPADDTDAKFSPDGTRIVFVSDRNGNPDVYVMNADGSGVTQLTDTAGASESSPVFSPDGTEIAFERDNDIYVMNADGSELIRASDGMGFYWDPAFSPDGSKILVASPIRDDSSTGGLFIMNANGTGLAQRLTTGSDHRQPVFSPDGQTIVFEIPFKLHRMNADGSGIAQLTSTPSWEGEFSPSFSADGSRIAYHGSTDGSTWDILLVSANGTGRTNLTNGTGPNSDPDWPGGPGLPFVCPATTAAGALDTCFNRSGMIVTRASADASPDIPHDAAYGLVVQPDGKLVVAGFANVGGQADFALARYNADGALDGTFGAGGIVTTPFGADTNDKAFALAIQPDGKLVAAGETAGVSASDFALARYNADGTLDTAFGTGGTVTTSVGTSISSQYEGALSIAIQSDGKIVVGGYTWSDGIGNVVVLLRYDAGGTLDATFGTGGIVTTTSGRGGAYALRLDESDRPVVAATTSSVGGRFFVARYTTAGALDPTFGSGGVATAAIGTSADAYALGIQDDGKIVAAGRAKPGRASYFDVAAARFNADGTLDPTFGTSGTTTTSFSAFDDEARALVIQGDGKLVVAGSAAGDPSADFVVARFGTDGSLDTTFDGDGKVRTFIREGDDRAYALAVQADGRLVAAGYSAESAIWDMALARYMP